MILHPPFEISSRLLPALKVEGAWIQLEYDSPSEDQEGRTVYKWTVDLPDGSSHSGNDLKSGCQGGNLQEGFSSLLTFLSACGAAIGFERRSGIPSENGDLFPLLVAEWAYENEDELSDLAVELSESNKPLIEEDS